METESRVSVPRAFWRHLADGEHVALERVATRLLNDGALPWVSAWSHRLSAPTEAHLHGRLSRRALLFREGCAIEWRRRLRIEAVDWLGAWLYVDEEELHGEQRAWQADAAPSATRELRPFGRNRRHVTHRSE